jgi:hypothetical protein
MAIQFCESYVLESIQAIHDFSSDTIKIALYTGDASFDADTTAYTATNEVPTGNGYTTGGATLVLSATYPKIEANGAAVRFDTAEWTFSATKLIKWALIYNSSKSNKAILSLNFGSERSATGTFRVNFPLSAPPLIYHTAPIPA